MKVIHLKDPLMTFPAAPRPVTPTTQSTSTGAPPSIGSTLRDTANCTVRSFAEFSGSTMQALDDIRATAGNQIFRGADAAVDNPRVGNWMTGAATVGAVALVGTAAALNATLGAARVGMSHLGYDVNDLPPEMLDPAILGAATAMAVVSPFLGDVEPVGAAVNRLFDALPRPVPALAPVLGSS